MEQYKLDRINDLARKSKTTGLTEEEKSEQAVLRKEFLAEIRADLKATLDSIEIIEDAAEQVKKTNNCGTITDSFVIQGDYLWKNSE